MAFRVHVYKYIPVLLVFSSSTACRLSNPDARGISGEGQSQSDCLLDPRSAVALS